MAKIEIEGDELVVNIQGWDKLLALRSSVRVPLSNISGVIARPADAHFDGLKGLRVAGGYWPGSFAAGYFWITGSKGEPRQGALSALESASKTLSSKGDDPTGAWAKAASLTADAIAEVKRALEAGKLPDEDRYLAFYDVHNPENAIGIDVEHQNVRRMVIEVDGETPDEAVTRIKMALTTK
jgi:hypothetical protein